MKKYILGLALITSASLTAQDALTKSMTDMREGLQSIQDGFSYNHTSGILSGIGQIQQANEIFHDLASSAKYLPQEKQNFAKISFLSAKNLNLSLDQMKEYVKMGNVLQASESMSGIVRSCTTCHAIVRGW